MNINLYCGIWNFFVDATCLFSLFTQNIISMSSLELSRLEPGLHSMENLKLSMQHEGWKMNNWIHLRNPTWWTCETTTTGDHTSEQVDNCLHSGTIHHLCCALSSDVCYILDLLSWQLFRSVGSYPQNCLNLSFCEPGPDVVRTCWLSLCWPRSGIRHDGENIFTPQPIYVNNKYWQSRFRMQGILHDTWKIVTREVFHVNNMYWLCRLRMT